MFRSLLVSGGSAKGRWITVIIRRDYSKRRSHFTSQAIPMTDTIDLNLHMNIKIRFYTFLYSGGNIPITLSI